jgi:hypothetical protein
VRSVAIAKPGWLYSSIKAGQLSSFAQSNATRPCVLSLQVQNVPASQVWGVKYEDQAFGAAKKAVV